MLLPGAEGYEVNASVYLFISRSHYEYWLEVVARKLGQFQQSILRVAYAAALRLLHAHSFIA